MENIEKGPLVLIVEDEPVNRKIIEKMVNSLGYETRIAQNGFEGLDLTKEHLPRVVLTDALIPKLDGREMCRRLKSDPLTSGVKVIIMTSLYTKSKYRNEAIAAFQVDEYLSKPLNLDELRTALQKCTA